MNWQEGGEEFWEFLYACLFVFISHYLWKRGRRIWWVYFIIYAYMFVFMNFIEYLYLFIIMHELRGSFYEAYL